MVPFCGCGKVGGDYDYTYREPPKATQRVHVVDGDHNKLGQHDFCGTPIQHLTWATWLPTATGVVVTGSVVYASVRVSNRCSDGRYVRMPDFHDRRRYGREFYTWTNLMAS